ncbi:hypothetical protein, partial [Pantoea ananatis]|uniref:hypothetical protein n=1 Tax=Pantoea ananas TaxID=553 RepID=UPI003C14D301
AGNRYDLVDRNYDIVMQYRKQTLLSIFLPPQVSGHARDTLTLTSSTLAVADITVSAAVGSTAAVKADRTVSFVADAPSDTKSTFVASPSLVVADGSTISTLPLKDVNGMKFYAKGSCGQVKIS